MIGSRTGPIDLEIVRDSPPPHPTKIWSTSSSLAVSRIPSALDAELFLGCLIDGSVKQHPVGFRFDAAI